MQRQEEGVARTPAQALAEAHRLLAEALPFHAHEVLEDAWKAAPPDERELWRGLAQLAVGATHAARGNRTGAVALLRRGASAIAPYADPRHAADAADLAHGLDVVAILRWCTDAVQSVGVCCPVTLPAPPILPQ